MAHSNRGEASYTQPPQEEYDPYRFSRNLNEQSQQQEAEDFYREIRLDAYENQADGLEDAGLGGGDAPRPVYRATDDYEEEYFADPNENRYSGAPSVYRPRDDAYEGDEEKFQLAQDESFDDGDWDEKEKELDFGFPFEEFEGGFGAPPMTAMTRRTKTARKVKLTEGNLVLDCAIPTRLATFLPRRDEEEYQTTRYTAVTCGPEDFQENKYILRPTLYNRQTELLIVVTLYNENEVLFCRTLHGIMKNIAHLCTRNKSKTWGKDGWKKIVVCIVADGRKAVHPRVFDCLAALGVYQEGMAKNRIGDKACQAHIYEYTTQLSIDPDLKFKGLEKGIVPTQIMFCLKEEVRRRLPLCGSKILLTNFTFDPPFPPQNAKKLNSHRWALQAFAPQLDPTVVILIDVGTKPGPKSLYFLWKTFDLNSSVGGACGEIVTMKGKGWMGLLNPLVAAQNFEYKMSNILDKPTESVFGYITVLPGAFSAYRYIALKNDSLGHGPLASYFKGEHLAGHEADVFTSNMYLAEDRILCWELVAKPGHSWVLRFVKSAQGETDVPDTIAEFISQRRRWLNGSFFAGTYALTHTMQLLQTEHSFGRKVTLMFQALYNFITLLFSWFGMANYWIFFMVLTSSLEDPNFNLPHIAVANTIVQYLYGGNVVACFMLAMGNRPQGSHWKYLTAIIIFALTTAYMLGAAAYCVFRAIQDSAGSVIFAEIIISLLSTYGSYVLASVFALDPWHLVTSMLQYMLFAPVYINLLNIFAFSNLHDFSWGTKEQTSQEIDLGLAKTVGKDTVEISLPSTQIDIDGAYDEALLKLKTRPMIIPRALNNGEKMAAKMDYYKNVRTNVLLAWVLSNALLGATILEGNYSTTFSAGGGNGRSQIYLVIVLVFVALMAVIRLVGSTTYLVMRLFAG